MVMLFSLNEDETCQATLQGSLKLKCERYFCTEHRVMFSCSTVRAM